MSVKNIINNERRVLPIKINTRSKRIEIGEWKSARIPFFPVKIKSKEKSSSLVGDILNSNLDFITEMQGIKHDQIKNDLASNFVFHSLFSENKNNNVIGYYQLNKIKEINQFICKYLGPQFHNFYRKCMFDIWVGSKGSARTAINATAFEINYYQISGYHPYLPVFSRQKKNILQAIDDGNANITPFMIAFDMNPEELKLYLGKSLWKRLCSSSVSRNKLTSYLLRECRKTTSFKHEIILQTKQFKYYLQENREKEICALTMFSKWKSTYLKYVLSNECIAEFKDIENLNWSYENLDDSLTKKVIDIYPPVYSDDKESKKRCNNPKIIENIELYRDTKKMASDNEQPFNSKWSKNRMLKEHDRLVSVDFIRKSKDNNYVFDLDYLEIEKDFIVEHDGIKVSVSVLKTTCDLLIEGHKMKHCVASYGDYIRRKSYLAFSLKSEHYSSTLGFNVDRSKTRLVDQYRFNQHYTRQNYAVENQAHVHAAETVLLKLIDP